MTIEQAVAALCTHLEAERASLEQLYYLLEHEAEAFKSLNRDRMMELDTYKLQLLIVKFILETIFFMHFLIPVFLV